jgi:polyhydroxyalkanoate synthase
MADAAAAPLAWLDELRRSRGAWLDAAGFGPVETPWRAAHLTDGMRLRVYGQPGPGPPLLIVPAPIKKPYIWDLAPGRSVVRCLLAGGFGVGLAAWTEPAAAGGGLGLDDHVRRLRAAMAAMTELYGSPGVLLAGHSLGGTLAAILAARHPELVRGLVLIEAPLHLGPDAGALGALAAATPWGPEAVRAGLRIVPGAALSALGVAADPVEFLTARWLDALAASTDAEAAATHARVLRWALDELAMPGQLFAEIAGGLCRDDAFHQGVLEVTGRRVAPERLAAPVLAVVDPHSRLVPPRSVVPFLERTGAAWTLRPHQEAEAGAALAHVGALVGRQAHRELWPFILRWLGPAWAAPRAAGPARPGASAQA